MNTTDLISKVNNLGKRHLGKSLYFVSVVVDMDTCGKDISIKYRATIFYLNGQTIHAEDISPNDLLKSLRKKLNPKKTDIELNKKREISNVTK